MTKKWGIWWGFLFHRCDGRAQRRVPWLLFVTTRCTDDVAAVGLYRGGLWTGVVKVPSPPKRAQARCVLRYYWEYYMPRYAHVWSRIFKGYVECSCDWVTPSHMFDVRTWISEVKYLCLADLFRTCWHCVIFRHSKYHALQDKLEPVSRKIFSAWAARAKQCDHSRKSQEVRWQPDEFKHVFRWGVHRAASRANRVILVHTGYRPLTPISCSLRGSNCQLSCSGANGKSNHASIHKKESAEREEVPGGNYLRILHAPRFWIHTVVFSK